jgi:hypothetical protein
MSSAPSCMEPSNPGTLHASMMLAVPPACCPSSAHPGPMLLCSNVLLLVGMVAGLKHMQYAGSRWLLACGYPPPPPRLLTHKGRQATCGIVCQARIALEPTHGHPGRMP